MALEVNPDSVGFFFSIALLFFFSLFSSPGTSSPIFYIMVRGLVLLEGDVIVVQIPYIFEFGTSLNLCRIEGVHDIFGWYFLHAC